MKTILVLITIAAVASAGYFYLNPRRPAPAPTAPIPVAVDALAPDLGQTTMPPLAATSVDERPLAAILRERVRWPASFTLTRPLRVSLTENGAVIGESVLEPGRTLRATAVTDTGLLKAWLGDREIEVPYENTDFVQRAAAAPAPTSQPATAEQMRRPAPARIQITAGNLEQRLAALKAKFPSMRTETVLFLKDKTYSTAPTRTTVTHVNGNTVVSNTSHGTGVRATGKPDSQTVEVPKPDIYSYYKGMVQTATLQGLPGSLERIEARIESDLNQLHSETGSLSHTINAAQAGGTISWINTTLRPYLAQLRAIANGR